TDARVTFVAQRVTVDWESALAFGTAYTGSIDEGAILADTATAQAWPAEVSFEFTTVAPPALELLATSPITGATDVDPNTNLVLTFSEAIVMGAGGLGLRQAGVLTERFD